VGCPKILYRRFERDPCGAQQHAQIQLHAGAIRGRGATR
jgi:hypothetical protein